jgi:type I restriction enzyme S subunit
MREGWEIKKIVDIGNIFSGNSINATVKEQKYTNLVEGVPYIATKDIGYNSIINYENGIKIPFSELSLFKVAPNNSVLICAEGGSAGRKIGITDKPICFVNKLFSLSPKKDILGKFVFYWYQTEIFQKEFKSNLTGIIGGVSKNKFQNLSIPIPSLPEQQQIVAILDKAFAAIDQAKANVERNLQNAKELFQSYLQMVFDPSTCSGQGREGWEENRLGDILYSPPKNGWSPPAKNHSDTGIPVLTLSAVTGFQFNANSNKHTNAIVDYDALYWVEDGDLLITRSNTPELVGHVAICSGLIEKTIYPDLMMKINPDESKVLTKFLYYQLRSPKLRRIIMESAHGANPTMKKINKQDVEGFDIIYPSTDEQQSIVRIFGKIKEKSEKLEAKYQMKLSTLDELKKSILQKAFSGELTISTKEAAYE